MGKHILVADDDQHIRDVISFALEKAGMRVVLAEDGRQVLDIFSAQTFDLIVLDINMPEFDGLEVCREIRKTSETPILFLSSRDDEIDRILGLEIGGDDYVTKPFSPRELVARINVILKRTQAIPKPCPSESVLQHGKLLICPEQHTASWEGQTVNLTATEFAMLLLMIRQPSRVFSRDQIRTVPTATRCMSPTAPSTATSAISARNFPIWAARRLSKLCMAWAINWLWQ